jgi:hypothetical protein
MNSADRPTILVVASSDTRRTLCEARVSRDCRGRYRAAAGIAFVIGS